MKNSTILERKAYPIRVKRIFLHLFLNVQQLNLHWFLTTEDLNQIFFWKNNRKYIIGFKILVNILSSHIQWVNFSTRTKIQNLNFPKLVKIRNETVFRLTL